MAGPLKIGVIMGVIFFSTPAFAQVCSRFTVAGSATITGLSDAGGVCGGNTPNTVNGAGALTLNGGDGTFSYSGTITTGGGISLIFENIFQTLSGANTYSGGTVIGANAFVTGGSDTALGTGAVTINNGGTLTSTDDEFQVFDLTVQAGGVLDLTGNGIVLAAGDHSLAGTVTGEGNLVLDNGAVVTLQALNVLSDATLVSNGTSTLDLNGFDQTIGVGLIAAGTTIDLGTGNATLTITNSFEVAGVFAGSGTVRIEPSVILFQVQANNIFQGGAALDITDTGFDLNGFEATFTEDTLISNITGSGIILGSGTAGTLNLDISSGEEIGLFLIIGEGDITKTGAGTLAFNEISISGAIDVDEGTLRLDGTNMGSASLSIDSGASLTASLPGFAGFGTNIVNSGTVSADVGQIFNILSYTGDGTLHFGLTDAASGTMNISNNMTLLPNSSIAVTAQSGGYMLGQAYTLVDVGGLLIGAVNVNGQTITTGLMELTVSAVDGPGEDIILTVTDLFGSGGGGGGGFDCSAVGAANTHNRCQVLAALDTAQNMNGTDIGAIYDALQLLSTEDARAALDSLSGDLVPQMSNVIFRHNDQFRDLSLNRISGLVKKVPSNLAMNQEPVRLASAGADMQQQLAMLMSNTGALLTGPDPALSNGVWGQALGQRDQAHEDNQLNATHYGFQGGADTFVDENVMLGVTGAWTGADVDMEDRPQDATMNSYQGGIYAAYQDGPFWLSGAVAYGFHQVDYGRDITVGTIRRHAEGEYDGHSISGIIEAAYGLDMGGGLFVTPAVGVRYSGLWQESFTETGADDANLHFEDEFDDNLVGTAVLSLSQLYITEEGNRVVPQLRLGAQYDAGDRDTNRDVTFVGLPTAFMDIEPAAWEGRLSGVVGLGLAWAMPADGTALVMDYEGRISGDLSSHRLFAGLRVQW
ncbi:MAG: autotransporter domain-containing protein [Pseudomonadota bacterium]|nr:autotransporter domain-containing protein [Pseudomonadota bacterium]